MNNWEKTLAIYFSEIDEKNLKYPLNDPFFFECYLDFVKFIEAHGVKVFFVGGSSYLGKGIFEHGWKFEQQKLVFINEKIQCQLIFNRDNLNTIPSVFDCKIINHPDLDRLCLDKYLTYKMFPEISPKTFLINSYQDFQKKLLEFNLSPSSLLVLKKNLLSSGEGVFILKTNEIKPNLYKDWNNILVQQFLDSSIGIPGLVEGLHDLRVTIVDGRIINSFIRKPKSGSYLANIAQGGTGFSVDKTKIPEEILQKTEFIINKIKNYKPFLISADFINSNQGFKLIELNSRPGLQHPKWSSTYKEFNNAVAKLLINTVSSD